MTKAEIQVLFAVFPGLPHQWYDNFGVKLVEQLSVYRPHEAEIGNDIRLT